jgi:hypothetical protein
MAKPNKYIFMPPKSTAGPQSKLAQLKAQISEQLNEDKKQFASIFTNVVGYVQGLDRHEIKEIVSDKVLKPALKKLGLQVIEEEPADIAKPKAKAKRGARRSKVSDEDIIKYLKTEHSVGDVRKDLGQLVPKRLEGLKKAGKLTVREEGIKKLWKAV